MSQRKFKCTSDPDSFCYICGKFTIKKNRRSITRFVTDAYRAYFDLVLGDQDKSWAPHIVCNVCSCILSQFVGGNKRNFSFGIPVGTAQKIIILSSIQLISSLHSFLFRIQITCLYQYLPVFMKITKMFPLGLQLMTMMLILKSMYQHPAIRILHHLHYNPLQRYHKSLIKKNLVI